jgi:uridylate kinase
MQQLKHQRVLLKLSGEALMGGHVDLFDKPTVDGIILQIKQLVELNIQLGIVIGGGNIFRGIDAKQFGLQSSNADYMGILATIMNGIAFKDFLTSRGIRAKIYSAIPVGNIVKGYNRDSMLNRLENGNVIIFAGGTGNPFFTTDSAAALRAVEMEASLLIKATKVNGIYDCDPKKNPQAKKYATLSFDEAISQNLKIMDLTAFDLCKQYKINIEVCDIFSPNSLKDAVTGNSQGTVLIADMA